MLPDTGSDAWGWLLGAFALMVAGGLALAVGARRRRRA
jgi:LPXTG-motif cell wall-anchored protein